MSLGEWAPTFRNMLAFSSSGSSRLELRPVGKQTTLTSPACYSTFTRTPPNNVLKSHPAKCHRTLATKTHVSSATGHSPRKHVSSATGHSPRKHTCPVPQDTRHENTRVKCHRTLGTKTRVSSATGHSPRKHTCPVPQDTSHENTRVQ